MIGKNIFKAWFNSLRPVDILIIGFTHILSLLSVMFSFGSLMSIFVVATNLLLAAFIIQLGKTVENSQSSKGINFNKIISRVQDWYPIPMIYFIFKEVHFIIQGSERADWDNIFIAIDRIMFGADPTVWLTQFATPLLTEILQIAYTSYYFIMLAVGIELYVRRDQEKFLFAVFTVVYGFALSYLGYIAFPAVGPRFTLHDFYALNNELPGLWLTNCLRDFINAGESIPKGSLNALALAQRDVFPSGHTQMTILSMYFAQRYKLKVRYMIHLLGSLLIVGTVYLRYHYVIDLIGGVVFMIFTIWSAPKLVRWWERLKASPVDL